VFMPYTMYPCVWFGNKSYRAASFIPGGIWMWGWDLNELRASPQERKETRLLDGVVRDGVGWREGLSGVGCTISARLG
jgi:hypothetical protein